MELKDFIGQNNVFATLFILDGGNFLLTLGETHDCLFMEIKLTRQ